LEFAGLIKNDFYIKAKNFQEIVVAEAERAKTER
jgi:hypothetical protein